MTSPLPELEAHSVLRYHAAPSVASQTLGHHHARVASLVLFLEPYASRELLIEALHHDVGELITGDIPFTAKRADPAFREACHAREVEARGSMPVGRTQPYLNDYDLAILKLADTLEGIAWCADNERQGGPVLPRWIKALEGWGQKYCDSTYARAWDRAQELRNFFLNPNRHHD